MTAGQPRNDYEQLAVRVSNPLVRQMLEAVEAQYTDTITLRTLSSILGRQPAYLGRLFREEVGSGVRDYLTRIRLKHAADLIREGVKIEAVALLVGYRSKKNFYRQFRQRYGTTPVSFRGNDSGPAFVRASPGESSVATTAAAVVRASNRALRIAVRAQKAMLRYFTRLQAAILLTNDAGRYVGGNQVASVLTGYSTIELRSLSPADLFPSAPSADARCAWQLVTLEPASPAHSTNAILRGKDGHTLHVHVVTLRNLLWGQRRLSGILEQEIFGGVKLFDRMERAQSPPAFSCDMCRESLDSKKDESSPPACVHESG